MPRLPREILYARVKHELAQCARKLRHQVALASPAAGAAAAEGGKEREASFPIKIIVTLINAPGPTLSEEGTMIPKFTHQFMLLITEEYPYKKPTVKWLTPIFHPNIKMPEDGGEVCTKLLKDWGFESTLVTFIEGIEALLANPNPASPWETDSCTRAAEYLNKYGNILPWNL